MMATDPSRGKPRFASGCPPWMGLHRRSRRAQSWPKAIAPQRQARCPCPTVTSAVEYDYCDLYRFRGDQIAELTGFVVKRAGQPGAETVKSSLMTQLIREAERARRVLRGVAEGRAEWKPHDRAIPFGYLAELVATIPSWIVMQLSGDELDVAPKDGTAVPREPLPTSAALVAAPDRHVDEARRRVHPRCCGDRDERRTPATRGYSPERAHGLVRSVLVCSDPHGHDAGPRNDGAAPPSVTGRGYVGCLGPYLEPLRAQPTPWSE